MKAKWRQAFTWRAQMVVVLALFLLPGCTQESRARTEEGIPPARVVELIHTVIEADRAVYADRVVHRLQNVDGVIKASEHFEVDKTLPLPAQMLRMGAQVAASKSDLRYALISPWAINKANLPKTDAEKAGLEAVIKDPTKPFSTYVEAAGKHYFVAVFPDKAVSPACVKCHNEHSESPRHDFKLDDVMGAVVISLPFS